MPRYNVDFCFEFPPPLWGRVREGEVPGDVVNPPKDHGNA
jgi:hypothetical protein